LEAEEDIAGSGTGHCSCFASMAVEEVNSTVEVHSRCSDQTWMNDASGSCKKACLSRNRRQKLTVVELEKELQEVEES
jgi:hypothetical protein